LPAVSLRQATARGLAVQFSRCFYQHSRVGDGICGEEFRVTIYSPKILKAALKTEKELQESISDNSQYNLYRRPSVRACIYGVVCWDSNRKIGDDLKKSRVRKSMARGGYGPLTYELAFYQAQILEGLASLGPDTILSKAAKCLWRNFHKRDDFETIGRGIFSSSYFHLSPKSPKSMVKRSEEMGRSYAFLDEILVNSCIDFVLP